MRLTSERFRDIVVELLDENPITIRPVLRILDTRFTGEVPTLAVTLEKRPKLLVNLDFLEKNCVTDEHVKAVIMHEFLHVLLGHTERFKTLSTSENVALDAVINAIIHRTLGKPYSEMFRLYYAGQTGFMRLLRPPTPEEPCGGKMRAFAPYGGTFNGNPVSDEDRSFACLWGSLYDGDLVADDILELAKEIPDGGLGSGRVLIGNHDGIGVPLPTELREALEEAMRQMNGHGIWRSPKDRGIGADEYQAAFEKLDHPMEKWKRTTLEALKRCLVPSRRSALRELADSSFRLPVLSPRDRRAFLRTMWSPVIPESEWGCLAEKPIGHANVYLDVSGSMNDEMPLVIGLLNHLRHAIRMPFWAFSTEVRPATIKNGQLLTSTTGGTSMNCVLAHVARHKPAAAVVVTDGYIEEVDRRLLASLGRTMLHAIVTRDGSTSALHRAGIPYTQLEKLPNG